MYVHKPPSAPYFWVNEKSLKVIILSNIYNLAKAAVSVQVEEKIVRDLF